MVRRRDLQLLQYLDELHKPSLNLADLEKILGVARPSLYVVLHRLVKQGVLVRLRRGMYRGMFGAAEAMKIANALYAPSYLSFESALARYGILSQIPYVLTFATTKRSKRMRIGETPIEFRQLHARLFFGYTLEQGVYLAEPEKALLDELYLITRGKATCDLDALNLAALSRAKFLEYALRFPDYVQTRAQTLAPRFGRMTTPNQTRAQISKYRHR
jgi:predicted transcriptional regulator of viral defense system